jgi:GDP-4-dehydro-6-deoxy-D-mannose reductase
MSQVLRLLVGMARCPVEVTRDSERLRPADVRSLRGDAAKLRDATGWRPEIPLEVSLADALDHARVAAAAQGAAAR